MGKQFGKKEDVDDHCAGQTRLLDEIKIHALWPECRRGEEGAKALLVIANSESWEKVKAE